MIFRVREIVGTPPAVSVTGVDHDFDYFDEADEKSSQLRQDGQESTIVVVMGSAYLDAIPLRDALKGEARLRLWAEWEASYEGPPDLKQDTFFAYMNGEGQARKVELQRQVTDEMRGAN